MPSSSKGKRTTQATIGVRACPRYLPADGHKADNGTNNLCASTHKEASVQTSDPTNDKPQNTNQAPNSATASINLIAPMHKNTVQTSINGRKTNALCDTGASISCCNKAFLQKVLHTESEIRPSHIQTVVGVGGEQHSVSGKIDLDLSFNGVMPSMSMRTCTILLF